MDKYMNRVETLKKEYDENIEIQRKFSHHFRNFLLWKVQMTQTNGVEPPFLLMWGITTLQYDVVKFIYDHYKFEWCYIKNAGFAKFFKRTRHVVGNGIARLVDLGVLERDDKLGGIRIVKKF